MAKKHLEDLLTDVSFVRWIRGEASPKENVKWKAWLQKDPEHQHLENDARELITVFQEEIYEIPDVFREWKKLHQLIDHEEMRDKILQKRKERHSLWKSKRSLFISLITAISLLFVSHSVKSQNSSDIQGIEQYVDLKKDQNMYLVIRSSLQKRSLENIVNEFREKGVNITFSNIQYNSDDLLTGIAMQVTIGDCDTGNGGCYHWRKEAYHDGSPINSDKPLIFYLYRKGRSVEAAGISYGYPQDLPPKEIKAMKNMTGSMIGILRVD